MSAIAAAVAIAPHSRPSVSSSTARDAPSASMSRSCSAASAGPSVSTVAVPPVRSAICTASSTAHSSCGLTVNPDMRVSTSWPSDVSTTRPPTIGTRLTQARTCSCSGTGVSS